MSLKSNKGVRPKKYGYKIYGEVDPVSYKDALSGSDSEYWLKAMKEEIRTQEENNTRATLFTNGFSQKY